jgi:hypothetical protein
VDAEGKPAAVACVTERRGRFAVYNFEVEGTHTYHAGLGGWWVHNDCIPVYRGIGPDQPPIGPGGEMLTPPWNPDRPLPPGPDHLYVTPNPAYAATHGDVWQTLVPEDQYRRALENWSWSDNGETIIQIPYSMRNQFPDFFNGWTPYPGH